MSPSTTVTAAPDAVYTRPAVPLVVMSDPVPVVVSTMYPTTAAVAGLHTKMQPATFFGLVCPVDAESDRHVANVQVPAAMLTAVNGAVDHRPMSPTCGTAEAFCPLETLDTVAVPPCVESVWSAVMLPKDDTAPGRTADFDPVLPPVEPG